MNTAVFEAGPLELEGLSQAREVLRCLLHTVLFHRALGVVRPKDTQLSLFDLVYAQCDDAELEAAVEGRVADFCRWAETRPERRDATVTLSFFEKRQKQAWFSSSEERMTWEQWRLHLRLARDSDAGLDEGAAEEARAARHVAAEAALRSAVMYILRSANERKEHIPPVVSAGVVSFPFDIALPPEEAGYGVDALKRLVMAARPPMNVL